MPAIVAILVSPRFLFRLEEDPTGAIAGTVRDLDGFERASLPAPALATATIVKLRSLSSSYSFCHTGRSRRQPHQEAQVASSTFLPRKSDRLCSLPSATS